MRNSYIIFLLLFLAIQGCAGSVHQSGHDLCKQTEDVMSDGMVISATNNFGTIVIRADEKYMRYYTWDGQTRYVQMIPRKERWYGKCGIYFPGKGNHWEDNHKITRGVLEESKINFSTLEEAIIYLQHPSRRDSTVYADNGLAITWSKSINPSGEKGSTLFVDVWQILINGKQPSQLLGSQDSKISVTYRKKRSE